MRWGWFDITTGKTDWYPTFWEWLRAVPKMWRDEDRKARMRRWRAGR